jgi:transposase
MDEHLFEISEGEARPRFEAGGDSAGGVPRLVKPNREQVELRAVDLESLLPADHPARAVWEFVESVDLGPLYEAVRSVEGGAGRPATDPRIHLALWLYATAEGVGSARALARLCEQHDAYRWICGGVSVNHHSLSDFRVGHVEFLDRLLTESVAVLMQQGAVELKRVAQDGMRVRASAGAASFRRQPSLTKCLRQAEEQVERLRRELEDDPEATSRRQKAARQRAAEERRRRVEAALVELPKVAAKKKAAERDKARVSTTDPEARVMKMADGGFRPAYNAQLAVDTASQIIVGVEVSQQGTDPGHLVPMTEQIRSRYGKVPHETLADGGFAAHADILGAEALGTTVFAPVTTPRDPRRDPHQPLPDDPPAIADWRQRMGTPAAREIYRERAATVECVNALARNRGLRQFPVRGIEKARATLLWLVLTHNLLRSRTLPAALPAAA